QPQQDPDYAQFVAETGFNFERDLDHLAIASRKSAIASPSGDTGLIFVAEGNFDRKKISAYAQRNGSLQNQDGREFFRFSVLRDHRDMLLLFLSDRRVLLASGTKLDEVLAATPKSSISTDWQQRFERLAGSPVFAVIRQDAAASFADRAPGGFRSPQLSSLLAQLQWITIAAKPDADQLRLVAEGESATESTQRQLADVLNGVVVLAETGLNDPKLRQQLAPDIR